MVSFALRGLTLASVILTVAVAVSSIGASAAPTGNVLAPEAHPSDVRAIGDIEKVQRRRRRFARRLRRRGGGRAGVRRFRGPRFTGVPRLRRRGPGIGGRRFRGPRFTGVPRFRRRGPGVGGRRFRGPRFRRPGRRFRGPRFTLQQPGFPYFYGGYWYGTPWWEDDLYYAYDEPLSYGGRCEDWSRQCRANWGYNNPDYWGCMRYHGCD